MPVEGMGLLGMRFSPSYALLLALAALLPCAQALSPDTPRLKQRQTQRSLRLQAAQPSPIWWKALQAAIVDIHRRGAGGYSTADAAHDALHASFSWSERAGRLLFNPEGARPSFCSGAVYAALLSALSRWDAAQPRRRISPEAWKALAPARMPDGVGVWGWANANGPGFAVLAHQLGAGVSFTDWAQARPADVMKIWWTDDIGAQERGHLVILVRDEGERVRVWSSHRATEKEPGGFGFRTYPKSAIRRVLFTRITKPAAFNHAPSIGENAWLMGLMQQSATWEECLRNCGALR